MELKQYKGRVYIASPYTLGDTEQNITNSLKAADLLLQLGFQPYAPLLNHYWHLQFEHSYDEWLQFDIAWMLQCDYVLRLPGDSKGADEEVRIAKANNITVIYSIQELLTENIYDEVEKQLQGHISNLLRSC